MCRQIRRGGHRGGARAVAVARSSAESGAVVNARTPRGRSWARRRTCGTARVSTRPWLRACFAGSGHPICQVSGSGLCPFRFRDTCRFPFGKPAFDRVPSRGPPGLASIAPRSTSRSSGVNASHRQRFREGVASLQVCDRTTRRDVRSQRAVTGKSGEVVGRRRWASGWGSVERRVRALRMLPFVSTDVDVASRQRDRPFEALSVTQPRT